MTWYTIAGIANIREPFIKRVKAGNTDICLVGYKGEVFAFTTWCPHQQADISVGYCDNDKLICPFHGYAYDLRTGKGGNGDHISTFPVKIKDETIYIGIGSVIDRILQVFK